MESSSASSAKKKSSHSLGSGKPRSGDVVAVHPPSLSSNKSQRRRGRTASTRIIGTTIGYIGNTATHIERGELPSRSAPSAIDHATRRGDTWCECRCRIRCTRINSGLRSIEYGIGKIRYRYFSTRDRYRPRNGQQRHGMSGDPYQRRWGDVDARREYGVRGMLVRGRYHARRGGGGTDELGVLFRHGGGRCE